VVLQKLRQENLPRPSFDACLTLCAALFNSLAHATPSGPCVPADKVSAPLRSLKNLVDAVYLVFGVTLSKSKYSV
jgi:hypothetical protein